MSVLIWKFFISWRVMSTIRMELHYRINTTTDNFIAANYSNFRHSHNNFYYFFINCSLFFLFIASHSFPSSNHFHCLNVISFFPKRSRNNTKVGWRGEEGKKIDKWKNSGVKIFSIIFFNTPAKICQQPASR